MNKLVYLSNIKQKLNDISSDTKHTPLIILDLDNTCISAVKINEIDKVLYPNEFNYIDIEDIYRIYERPGLQAFLDYVFEYYQVAIWTAAGLDYALFVINNIITKSLPERTIQFVMWDDHCSYSEKKSKQTQLKDLSLLYSLYNPEYILLIDDNEDVLNQPHTINSCYFDVTEEGSNKDRFLFDLPSMIKEYFSK
jgi:hypothetical protein